MGAFFNGAGGGLIGGLFGLAGSAIDAANSKKQQERQQQHDKDMAALNQQNQLEQMAVQNQYQLDQWNRENAYNDPSAVAARYREAGINPRAAFGQGSASGAGIAGGFSSAPSGSNTGTSSNIMFGTDFGGIAGHILAGARLQAQNRKDQADADKAEMEAQGKKYDNEVLAPLRSELQSALRDKAVSDAEISKITAQWEPYMADLRSRALEGNISNIEAQTATFLSKLENDEVYRSLSEEQKDLLKQQVRESEARVMRMAVQNAFDNAQIKLASIQGDVMKSQKELNEALKNKENKMLPYLDKQIEMLGNQMNLNNEQINKWKAEIKQQWTKIGTDIAFNTVAEARQWVGMFLPFGKSNPIGFGKR